MTAHSIIVATSLENKNLMNFSRKNMWQLIYSHAMGEFDSRHNTLAFGKVLGAQTRAPDWPKVGRVKIVCMYVCVCVCVCVCLFQP